MSSDIVIYQVGIFAIIAFCGVMFNEGVMLIAAALAVLFTIVMVFSNWLFILQLATIAAAVITGVLVRQSKNHANIQSTGWTVIAIAAFGIYQLVQSDKKEQPQQPPSTIPAPQSQPIAKPSMPLPETNAESQRIDDAIAALKSKYPELNQNSYAYSQVLVDRVLSRQEFHIRNGHSPSTALLKAAEEVMKQQYSPTQTPPPSSPHPIQRQQRQITNECISANGTITPPPCRRGDSFYIHN